MEVLKTVSYPEGIKLFNLYKGPLGLLWRCWTVPLTRVFAPKIIQEKIPYT